LFVYIENADDHNYIVLGEDLLSLLYHLLDEFLFLFSAEPFFIARVCGVISLLQFLYYYIFRPNPSYDLTNIFESSLFLGRNSEQDWLCIYQTY